MNATPPSPPEWVLLVSFVAFGLLTVLTFWWGILADELRTPFLRPWRAVTKRQREALREKRRQWVAKCRAEQAARDEIYWANVAKRGEEERAAKEAERERDRRLLAKAIADEIEGRRGPFRLVCLW